MTTKDALPNSARLLLSNVTVLSTVVANTPATKPGAAAPAAAGATYFTLSLTPAEAEKVIFAETYEQVWFGLVHPGDPPATSGGQVLNTLFK